MAEQKNITLTLMIKQVTYPATEKIPVLVYWQRGGKKASTKKRLLQENHHTAVFDEKFQINTKIDVDADGNPTKPKISKLTVASDKVHGLLGKTDLDLSKFGKDDYLVQTLQLEKVDDQGMVEGASIEVALKGAETAGSPSGAASPAGAGSLAGDDASSASLAYMVEALEKLKKEKQSAAAEGAKQVTALKNKNNELQTALGNSEHESGAARQKAAAANAALTEATKKLETVSATVAGRGEGVRRTELALEAVEQEISGIQAEVHERQKQIDEFDDKTKTCQEDQKSLKKQMMNSLFKLENHDFTYISEATSFSLPDVLQAMKQVKEKKAEASGNKQKKSKSKKR